MIRTLVFLLSFSFFASAQSVLRPIEFNGILNDDLSMINKRYSKSVENGASLTEISEIIGVIFKTNRYDMVEAREKRINGKPVAVIIGTPVEIIDKVTISGNDELSDKEIIQKLEIEIDKRLPKANILKNIANVEEAYQKLGYLNAKIKVDFKTLNDERVEVIVNVDEGQPCEIKNINIETSNPELLQKLNHMVRSYKSSTFKYNTIGNIREEFMEYFVSERYLNATILEPEIRFSKSKTEVKIKLTVENPYRYSLIYYGNQHFNSVQLSRYLKLNTQERFGLNPSAEISDRLRIIYQKQGFANAKVTFEEQVFAKEYVKKVRLNIEEGPRVRIHRIQVAGKISQKASYYSDFIEDHSSDLISLGYYNLDDLELGYKNLITELQNQGFLQAKLQSSRSEFQQSGRFVTIKVYIDEGPRTTIRSLRFKGVSVFSPAELLDVIKLKSGDPLSLNKFEDSIPKLREFYTSRGYLDVRINEDYERFVVYNESNTEAEIEYEIQEGPKVEVAAIIVQGNELTNDDVILREIDFKEGDTLTSGNISESEFRLQRLGLFSSVAIRTLERDTQLSKRTVIIEVSERNPGLFNVGGSINNELGDQHGISFLAYSGIAYRNLAGTARAISLRGEMNYNFESRFTEYDLTASYLEPFVFNDRVRGRVNFSRSVRVFKSELERLIGLETNQMTSSLERDLSRTVRFTWNLWSLANTRKFAARGNYLEEKLTIATIGPQLDWDLRDHPFTPTKGILYRIGAEYSHPDLGSTQTVHFYKATSSINTYLPLKSRRFVWANSLRGGYLQNLSHLYNGRVPEEVMFSLGGRSTIRGFDPQSIPPRNEFLSSFALPADSPMYVPTDSHFYLMKSEFRFPFWGEFGGVIFYDGGSVKISGIQFEDEYRDAAGIGFRYNTPVGPVSAEFAWKLDRRDFPVEEPPFRFHFSIGAF